MDAFYDKLERLGQTMSQVNAQELTVLSAIEKRVKPVIRLLNKAIPLDIRPPATYHEERGILLIDGTNGANREQLWFTRSGRYLLLSKNKLDEGRFYATYMTTQQAIEWIDALLIIQGFKHALLDEIDNAEEKIGLLKKRMDEIRTEQAKITNVAMMEE